MAHQDANDAKRRTHLQRLRRALLLVIVGLLSLALAELMATALNSWRYVLWDLLGDLLHPDVMFYALSGVGYATTGAGLLLVSLSLTRLRAVHTWGMALTILMSLVLLYASIVPLVGAFYGVGPLGLGGFTFLAPFMPVLAVICLGLIGARLCYKRLAAVANIPFRHEATIAFVLAGIGLLTTHFVLSLSIDSAHMQMLAIDDTVSPAEALAAEDHLRMLLRLFHYLTLANAAALGITAVFLFVIRRDLRRTLTRNECPHCGYDLRGSADRCPECGASRASAFYTRS